MANVPKEKSVPNRVSEELLQKEIRFPRRIRSPPEKNFDALARHISPISLPLSMGKELPACRVVAAPLFIAAVLATKIKQIC